jgi:SAM-dependent methyltransferase
VLHFSPPSALSRCLRGASLSEYVTTDFEDEFVADEQYDITNIDRSDNSFDLIICYHVLEHIPDDRAAMRELYRVLAPGGLCLIQTPFREGEIYEDGTITDAAGRLAAFGQEDHVRVYSVAGLVGRLETAGFSVDARQYSGDEFYGWRDGETVLWARKGKVLGFRL